MTDQEELIATSLPFLDEIKNMTAGSEVEQWLNATHGPGSPLYERLAALVKAGVRDGWAANVEIQGKRYRRSRISVATPETLGFSITAVYMDSTGNDQGNAEGSFRGDYHAHPYGEFNMVVPLNDGAALAGPNGWCYGGWTAPPPGSHHYPEAKGGAVIALFYLPAGRISYDIQPPA
ncbi:hypothetical protein H4CHR_02793 [Variovorax sp. PBS-H4]|uniref:4-hydroxylaminobenzoate lyase n=1 Tax=Variovorax sp. PBS-H4 TaxID=434008 RepID=UPI001317E693|nr:DUF4863 family protein [Variovorax sp. PBS-H4]VTU31368.1 hypothetical protein H4CHR_02793 [Variovorax sp. PBS-H4]